MIEIGDDKFNPPLAKTWFLAKKGLKTLKISQKLPKTQPSQIELKISG